MATVNKNYPRQLSGGGIFRPSSDLLQKTFGFFGFFLMLQA